MPKTTKELIPSEVKYGLIYVSDLPRDLLPGPSEAVTIIDDSDGQRYGSKMHSFQPRIDGLTHLHRKHSTKGGQSVTVEVKPHEKATVHVLFGGTSLAAVELTAELEPDEAASGPRVESRDSESLLVTASLDSVLGDLIAANPAALEPGLRLYSAEDGRIGRQYPTEVGAIDLLGEDNDGSLVIVELGSGRQADEVVGQISRHMGWAKVKLAKGSQKVRGIVVLHRPPEKCPWDEGLEYAILANPNIEIRYYQIRVDFFDRGETFSK